MQFHGTADRYTLTARRRDRHALLDCHHRDDATRP